MSTDIELLPLPEALFETGSLRDLFNVAQMQGYARANVAHATAAKDAEIEALRVRADAMAGEAIKHEARADRLAEALRDALGCGEDGDWQSARNYINEALRDHGQEVGNE